MTLKEFSNLCNIELEDLIEVLNWMKFLNKDNTDWTKELYDNHIVLDLNNIKDTKWMKHQLSLYRNTLYEIMYSRVSKNEFDLPKLYYKEKIRTNDSILRFIKSNI